MDNDNRKEIELKLAAIEREFKSRWGRHYFKGALGRDINALEQTHATVKVFYKLSSVVAKIFSLLLMGLVMVNILEFDLSIDLNRLGILIIFAFVFLINSYRTYKLMVNLEVKIFLLKLLEGYR